MATTMMNERYAVEEGEEEDDVSYTSFKTISTVATSDGEQTKCEEQCNTAFTSYQTISTVRTWNEEDDTQAENSTDSPCISQSSEISTCRKDPTSHAYYSGLSFKRSKVEGSLFNLNQMNGTFQVLMDVEEHISSSSCGSCPDPSLKQATDPMVPGRIKKPADRISALHQLVAPFGKADTASVLMDSIDSILFLQQQVEVPAWREKLGVRIDALHQLISPFGKVPARREKLGDRIDALHQLVSPFGKADTASVLMESIEYILFLQQQVEALLNRKDRGDIELDLKSLGLCLVPTVYVSSLNSQVNRENRGSDYGGSFKR